MISGWISYIVTASCACFMTKPVCRDPCNEEIMCAQSLLFDLPSLTALSSLTADLIGMFCLLVSLDVHPDRICYITALWILITELEIAKNMSKPYTCFLINIQSKENKVLNAKKWGSHTDWNKIGKEQCRRMNKCYLKNELKHYDMTTIDMYLLQKRNS